MKLDLDFSSATERALIRLYHRSASETPPETLDLNILSRSTKAARGSSVHIPLAMAASLFLAITMGFLFVPRILHPPVMSLSILSPWVPFEAYAEPAQWPEFQHYRFLKPAAGLEAATTLAVLDQALSLQAIGDLFPASVEMDAVDEANPAFQPDSVE
jgi:hypothetical protein